MLGYACAGGDPADVEHLLQQVRDLRHQKHRQAIGFETLTLPVAERSAAARGCHQIKKRAPVAFEDRVLDDLQLPYRLAEVPFEVVSKVDDCFYCLWLANNQFGISFLIPDAEWVTGDLRKHLLENLDE